MLAMKPCVFLQKFVYPGDFGKHATVLHWWWPAATSMVVVESIMRMSACSARPARSLSGVTKCLMTMLLLAQG